MTNDRDSIDPIAWVKRANGRWIVHHGLAEQAEMYLARLERDDPPRLAASCRNARLLARQCGPVEDPKPWFYGGLFSLATADEAAEFLAGHHFTAAVVPSACDNPELVAWLETVGDSTRENIRRIRDAIARRPAPE